MILYDRPLESRVKGGSTAGWEMGEESHPESAGNGEDTTIHDLICFKRKSCITIATYMNTNM